MLLSKQWFVFKPLGSICLIQSTHSPSSLLLFYWISQYHGLSHVLFLPKGLTSFSWKQVLYLHHLLRVQGWHQFSQHEPEKLQGFGNAKWAVACMGELSGPSQAPQNIKLKLTFLWWWWWWWWWWWSWWGVYLGHGLEWNSGTKVRRKGVNLILA